MLAQCPACGKENEPHYRFCLGCGANLPASGDQAPPVVATYGTRSEGATARCGTCGKENASHYKFCLGCGAGLSPGDSPAERPPLQKTACYNCGASNCGGLTACAKCGSPLSAATTERGSSKSLAVVLGLVVVLVVAAVGIIAAQVG